jgi:hypothetical protein
LILHVLDLEYDRFKQAGGVMAKAVKKQDTKVASKAKAPSRKKKNQTVSVEVKQQMIAEAAFYNSQKRAQVGGDPVQDWLLAEQQIEQQLSG